MSDNCAKSCGTCGGRCADLDSQCGAYVAAFGCKGDDNFSQYLRDACPKSCKACASAAAEAPAAGQQCVDLSSACDVFKARFTCKPTVDAAEVFMKANCQATCELCPVTGEPGWAVWVVAGASAGA